MPYNMTPINPATEVTGTCALPLARVQRMITADPDTGACSKNAAFAIAVATEMFVQHLVETTQTVVAAENARGGRAKRSIQYRHIAAAVAKFDNLEWLGDVVPNTVLYKDYQKMRRTNGDATKGAESLTNGQQKLSWGQTENDQSMGGDGEGERFHSMNGGRTSLDSMGVKHTYDAVRDGYDTIPAQYSTMDED